MDHCPVQKDLQGLMLCKRFHDVKKNIFRQRNFFIQGGLSVFLAEFGQVCHILTVPLETLSLTVIMKQIGWTGQQDL